MKKAVIFGPRQAGLVEATDPQAKEDWALVKVHAAPMCAEYKQFLDGGPTHFLGHEAAGEVVAVAQPGRVRVGDRVVVMPQYPCGTCALCVSGDYIHCERCCDFAAFTGSPEGSATMAQYLLKPSWLLPRIPDDVSFERASLACCALGPSFNAWKSMGVGAGDTVLVTGAGPVGLGAVVNARFRGAQVLVVESAPWRAERARQMGAAVLDPREAELAARVKDLTGGVGVDAALDTSGVVAAQRHCLDATRRKGQVAFVGECGGPLEVRISPDFIRTGVTVRGCWHYNLSDFPKIMTVIQQSPLIDRLISHTLPMSRIQEAFELCAAQQTAKVILKPWE